ncbi:MAG: hypothetical protein KIS92_08690 [Planctomycetota bacterium]|nr:hypothetical protein [Planctomycetota bacterium]
MTLRAILLALVSLAACLGAGVSAAEPPEPAKTEEPKKEEKPEEAGVEKKLEGADAEAALKAIGEYFAKTPCLKARVKRLVKDELLGDQMTGGSLVLQRPDKMYVRMDGPPNAHLFRQLDGTIYREFNMATRKVTVKDFGKAPKKLALLRGAMTVDLAVLKEYFDIAVYRTFQGADKSALLRLVLTPSAGAKISLPWEKVEAKLNEGAPFLNSIAYQPKKGHGEPVYEEYDEFKVLEQIDAKDFVDDLVAKSAKVEEKIADDEPGNK